MKFIRSLAMLTLVVLACTLLFSYAHAANRTSETYYTKVNIWYEKPSKIMSTNYHKGARIPFGTKVKDVKRTGKVIRFREESADKIKFRIINVYKYSLVSTEDLLSRYFSSSDPRSDGDFAKLSSQEKQNIEDGVIAKGMCKEAVVMAYGYPPTHRTPRLTDNTWYYWRARTFVDQVTFKDNKIISIGKANSREMFGE